MTHYIVVSWNHEEIFGVFATIEAATEEADRLTRVDEDEWRRYVEAITKYSVDKNELMYAAREMARRWLEDNRQHIKLNGDIYKSIWIEAVISTGMDALINGYPNHMLLTLDYQRCSPLPTFPPQVVAPTRPSSPQYLSTDIKILRISKGNLS